MCKPKVGGAVLTEYVGCKYITAGKKYIMLAIISPTAVAIHGDDGRILVVNISKPSLYLGGIGWFNLVSWEPVQLALNFWDF